MQASSAARAGRRSYRLLSRFPSSRQSALLSALDLPAVEGFHGGAARPAIFARARNPRFENARRRDHVRRDAGEGYLQSAAPARISLARVRPDVDVDKPLTPRALHT